MYTYTHVYTCTSPSRLLPHRQDPVPRHLRRSSADNRELEYRIPRLHSPANSRDVQRFSEMFGDLCKNKPSFMYTCVSNRVLPFAAVDVEHRSPYPVFKLMGTHASTTCRRSWPG